MNLVFRTKCVEYSQAKNATFEHSDTDQSPSYLVDADAKKTTRLNGIHHLLLLLLFLLLLLLLLLLSKINYHPKKYAPITSPIIDRKNVQRPPH
jgi:hypothetical protein